MGSIGAGHLNKEGISNERKEIFECIIEEIDGIRSYKKVNEKKSRISKEIKNNFISILGERGAGKTSMLLTILDEINDKNKSLSNNKIKKDFIIPIIDPDKMNLEKNSLGWIIYSFDEVIQNIVQHEKVNKEYCTDNRQVIELEVLYKNLKTCYIRCREFYRNNLATLSDGKIEYEKVNQNIILADINLEKLFNEFVEKYIEVIKFIEENEDNMLSNEEPLIFISFDDIDIKPKYGPEILNVISNYLAHPNIVVLICGEENTFKESLVIDMWNRYDIPESFQSDLKLGESRLFHNISNRADDVLAKILPAKNKYHLNGLTINDRLNFRPYGNLEKESIAELLSRFTIGGDKNKTLLNYFIEPLIDLGNIEINKDKLDYNGSLNDIEELKLYNERVKNYPDFIENLSRDSIEDRKNNIEEINKYNASAYAYLLPKTSRGLINFYYRLETLIKRNKNIDRINSINGYDKKRKTNRKNFKFLFELFELIRESNTELIHYNNIKKVISFDTINKKIEFNFEIIKVESAIDFRQNLINVSDKLILKREFDYDKNNNKKYKRLLEAENSTIQLFYDLAKEYLLEDSIRIIKDKSLYGLPVYRRESDDIEIITNDFVSFGDYYKFQTILKLIKPKIIISLQNHRSIRQRLSIQIANILMFIFENKYYSEKSCFNINFHEKKDINFFEFDEKYKMYYENEYIYLESDSDSIISLLRFVCEFKEHYNIFRYLDRYMDNSDLGNYIEILSCYFDSNKSKELRIKNVYYTAKNLEKLEWSINKFNTEGINNKEFGNILLEVFDLFIIRSFEKIFDNKNKCSTKECENLINRFVKDLKKFRNRIIREFNIKIDENIGMTTINSKHVISSVIGNNQKEFSDFITSLKNDVNSRNNKDLEKFENFSPSIGKLPLIELIENLNQED